MKKFLILALAASLCLAFTLPAMAKVTVGGRATLEWTYTDRNPANQIGGNILGATTSANGFNDMNFIPPWTLNRLNAKYTSDDGALVGFVEIRGGGPNDAPESGVGAGAFGGAFFNYSYIQWQVTPTAQLTFGKQTTAFARFIPQQWVGTHIGSILQVGWGNVQHGTARTGIKGYHRFSDMFGLVWGLFDADATAPSVGIVLATTSPAAVAAFGTPQENKWPRIDLALPIRFPWGRIEPSVTWSTATYDQFPPGAEDSYDMYGVSLGGNGSFGMFSFAAEFTYGRNLGGGSYRGAEGGTPIAYVDTAGNIRIADADTFAWFIDIGFKFGPNKIDLYYSQIKYENDGDPAVPQTSDSAEFNRTRSMYGISWGIGVAKGFSIRPELNYYDYDTSAQILGTTVDLGKQWVLGIQFMLVF